MSAFLSDPAVFLMCLILLAGRPQLTGEQFEALKRGELT